MRSERESCATFYGMMILEGLIAMIWAASALAIYNLKAENLSLPGATVLGNIATHFLGPWMGGVTVCAVVVLAVTSGDTALRSARMSLAEMCRIDQVPIVSRVLTCLPLIVLVSGLLWWSNLSPRSFNSLWNYFAWGNQVIASTVLMCGAVYLLREGRRLFSLVALLPGMFMVTVVVSFILWTPGTNGQPWGLVPGGLKLNLAIAIDAALAVAFALFAIYRSRHTGQSN